MSTFVSDTVNVMNRELKPVWREPMAVVFAMIQPLVFLDLTGRSLRETQQTPEPATTTEIESEVAA